MNFIEFSRQEQSAIKTALELIGYYDVAENEDIIQAWLDDDTISICKCRNERDVAWILTDCKEICLYVDTLERLSSKEIKQELM